MSLIGHTTSKLTDSMARPRPHSRGMSAQPGTAVKPRLSLFPPHRPQLPPPPLRLRQRPEHPRALAHPLRILRVEVRDDVPGLDNLYSCHGRGMARRVFQRWWNRNGATRDTPVRRLRFPYRTHTHQHAPPVRAGSHSVGCMGDRHSGAVYRSVFGSPATWGGEVRYSPGQCEPGESILGCFIGSCTEDYSSSFCCAVALGLA